jgi:hypothetical protein
MTALHLHLSVLCLTTSLLGCAASTDQPATQQTQSNATSTSTLAAHAETSRLNVYYLEIVTASVDETCEALARAHDVEFSEPIAQLGNARTADLSNGGRIGVRAPARVSEAPVVRPYLLVHDIQAALQAAEAAGGMTALPPTEMPGQGRFAIYILGGIEHGLWQR